MSTKFFGGAFSFGKSQRGNWITDGKDLSVPGPGNDKVEGVFYDKKQARQVSLNTTRSEKDFLKTLQIHLNKNPAPNSYKSIDTLGQGRKTVISKPEIPKIVYKDKTGPGSYEVRSKIDAKSFSFGYRFDASVRSLDIPSPDTYDVSNKSVSLSKSHNQSQFHFGKSSLGSKANKNPGPGSYNLGISQFQESHRYSITKSQSNDVSQKSISTLGPGQYELNSTFSSDMNAIKFAISQDAKFSDPKKIIKNNNPGPQHPYFPRNIQSQSSIRFGSESRKGIEDTIQLDFKNPGPGTYDLLNNSQSKFFQFGSSQRAMNSGNKDDIPPPGSYETMSFTSESIRSATIKGKNYPKPSKFKVPGPGQYRPNFTFTKMSAPSYSSTIGFRSGDFKKPNIPGPGTYDMLSKKIGGPEYTIGEKFRQKTQKDEAFSDIQISSSIGFIPNYLMSPQTKIQQEQQ